jgi:hypothetical protein
MCMHIYGMGNIFIENIWYILCIYSYTVVNNYNMEYHFSTFLSCYKNGRSYYWLKIGYFPISKFA